MRAPSPHVLFVTGHWPPAQGGMATSADRIVGGLRGRGTTVDVLHLSSRARRARRTTTSGGSALIWPVGPDLAEDLAGLLPALPRWTGAWDVIVSFGGPLPLFVGPTLAGWLKLPLVVALRGADIDTGMFHPRRLAPLQRALHAAAQVVVVSGDKVAKARALGATAPIAHIPNGIDLDAWQALPSDRVRAAQLRATLRGTKDPLILACIGHLKRKKGVGTLARAIVSLKLQDQLILLLAGTPSDAVQAELDAAREAGLSIHQQPFVDRERLLGVLPAADVVALPSVHDGMPNVMLEAGGLGLPLLASRAGGMGDHLVDGEHGWLFDVGDEDALRHAIWRMVQDRADAPARGARWRARVAEQFTIDAEAQQWHSVLSAVVTGPALASTHHIEES